MIKKTNIIILIALIFSPIIFTYYKIDLLYKKDFLIKEIKSKNIIPQKKYSIKKYSNSEIKEKLSLILDPVQRLKNEDLLKNETIDRYFFYMIEKDIEYFISANFEIDSENQCRLVVKSNFFIIKLLNKINFLKKMNHKEYSIDKNICNSLYGYGKINL